MDSRNVDKMDELPVADTPEDVAVLYSWANLHGAKYRDFSASRREYRAQLRHRAAEQMREQELKAQADAEAAAVAAETMAREAQVAAMTSGGAPADSSKQQALREAGHAARMASAERVEAARRAEAAAVAEAEARRAEREIAEATESARLQASRYTDSEIRRRVSGESGTYTVPGEISDPYVPHPHLQSPPLPAERVYERPATQRGGMRPLNSEVNATPVASNQEIFRTASQGAAPRQTVVSSSSSQRRRQGYTPDDASGVRQIYRSPEFDEPREEQAIVEPIPYASPAPNAPDDSRNRVVSQYGAVPVRSPQPEPGMSSQVGWPFSTGERGGASLNAGSAIFAGQQAGQRPGDISRIAAVASPRGGVQYPQIGAGEQNRGRRAQDDFGYRPEISSAEVNRKPAPQAPKATAGTAQRSAYLHEAAAPAWLYAPQTPAAQAPAVQTAVVKASTASVTPPRPGTTGSSGAHPQSSVADTLQHSRERVAARWYALKGVFEPGQEQQETPVRQKEIRTPVLAVFSLAGGVGKTSLVATLGRALSAMGEKVLLTDTTSHGLLPFYFGASELRQGVVRTFSPPSGSTDAPIYLLSYDVAERGGDEAGQEKLVEEIKTNSKGTHRILLDLTPGSGWVARKMARMNPTVLVPVAPDMNSVISLQTVEKYFHGTVDADGRPLQPYYVINQFDASLPLHLDVREVMRRQLGERLLPFVIRRSPSVSEALAEGMTIVDYAPEAPIAEDYQNVAAWLRTIAAPATAGFRNVRWSER